MPELTVLVFESLCISMFTQLISHGATCSSPCEWLVNRKWCNICTMVLYLKWNFAQTKEVIQMVSQCPVLQHAFMPSWHFQIQHYNTASRSKRILGRWRSLKGTPWSFLINKFTFSVLYQNAPCILEVQQTWSNLSSTSKHLLRYFLTFKGLRCLHSCFLPCSLYSCLCCWWYISQRIHWWKHCSKELLVVKNSTGHL